jgi:uncharacterized protein YegP (UPF0339 family)
MTKWIRSLVLATAVAVGTAGLVTLGGTAAHGQGKDVKKAEDKGKTKAPEKAEAKGSVVITKDKQGKFRFQVRDGDDKVVMQCVKGYETEKDAVKAFEDALAIAKVAKPALEKDGK